MLSFDKFWRQQALMRDGTRRKGPNEIARSDATRSKGPHVLKRYLEYAENRGRAAVESIALNAMAHRDR
jgi:hypothetical protein